MTKIITLARNLDQWIINALQKSYLWLLDRTGTYLATVQLILFAYGTAISIQSWNTMSGWLISIMVVLGALNLLALGHRYWLQGSGNNTMLNVGAEAMKSHWFRHLITTQMIVFFLLEVLAFRPLLASEMFAYVIYGYGFILSVRDREKKPFFEKKEELAMEGA